MNKFKKRCLSTALGLIMVAVNTLSSFSYDVFGNVSTPTAQVASTSNAQANSLSAIGIDTTKAPEGFDEYDNISNPYGTNVMTPKPVSELLIADDESGSSFKLYGHNKAYSAKNKNNSFLGDPIESEDDKFFSSSSISLLNLPSDTVDWYADCNLVSGDTSYIAVLYRRSDGKLYLGVRGEIKKTEENEDTAKNDICISESDTVPVFPLGYNLHDLSFSSFFNQLGYGGALICQKDRIAVYNGKYLKGYSYNNGSLSFLGSYNYGTTSKYCILLSDTYYKDNYYFYAFKNLSDGEDSKIDRFRIGESAITHLGDDDLEDYDDYFDSSPFFDKIPSLTLF